jgi:hypothetical protein
MAEGLAALGVAFGREITGALANVYHGVIGPRLSAVQWETAVRRALEAETFFPPPATLLRYGLAGSARPAQAGEAFEGILSAYASGNHLGAHDVERVYGRAARDGFLAAGGRAVFEVVGGEGQERARAFALRDFREAWIERVETDATAGLPPGQEAPQIDGGFTRDEARALLRLVGDRGASS